MNQGIAPVSGARFGSARVTPVCGQTDTARPQGTVQTEADGGYSIPGLPVGGYQFAVAKQSFQPITREVTLQISQVAAVNFTLALGVADTLTQLATLIPVASGTLARNVLADPGTRRLDFPVLENFRLTERIKTQLRIEVFISTNTPQFREPNGDITSVGASNRPDSLRSARLSMQCTSHFEPSARSERERVYEWQ